MHREILSKKENFTSKPSLFARKKSWNRNKLSNRKNFAKIDDLRYCSQSQKVLSPKNFRRGRTPFSIYLYLSVLQILCSVFRKTTLFFVPIPKRSFYGNYRQTWTNKQRWTRLDNITQDWYIIADKHQECDVNIFIMGIIYPKIMHTKLSCM